MRHLILLLAMLLTGCFQLQSPPTPPPTTISSWSPLGGFSMSSGASCAGHAILIAGSATINDPCFTGSSNVVLCTDTTSAAAVACSPGSGILTITGTRDDSVAYARVR
jgi:hypothetical protein